MLAGAAAVQSEADWTDWCESESLNASCSPPLLQPPPPPPLPLDAALRCCPRRLKVYPYIHCATYEVDCEQFRCRSRGPLPSCYCNLHSSTVDKLYVDGGCGVGDLVAVAAALMMLLLLPSRSGPTATGGPPVAVAVGSVVLLLPG